MALTFCAIAAHTPLLLPLVAKENIKLVDKTKSAMERLEQELYISHPDIVIVLSPHGEQLADAISINMDPKYVSKFDEFGDMVTKIEWKPATMLIDRFREDFKTSEFHLVLSGIGSLDYGMTVPLFYLTRHLPEVRIIPMNVSSKLDVKTHFAIGQRLKNEIMGSTKRIAVIASADLSHRVGENSPDGFSPRGVAFDDRIQEIVRDKSHVGILDIDDAWQGEAKACGIKTLAMIFGLLDGMSHTADILSYEKPLGVGYLVAAMRVA